MNLIGKAAITTAFIAFGAVAAFGLPPYTGNTSGTDSAAILNNLNDINSALSSGSANGGNVASGATDSGNPVKIGGVYNSTPPTVTTGQRVDMQTDSRGSLHTVIYSQDSNTPAPVGFMTVDGISNATAGLTTRSAGLLFNGSTLDRAFTCASQASATITAGSTTQIVALSGSTNIRVCSYQVGIATTGTFKFVSGTGSNCGTGTADITPATNLIAGNVVAVSAGNNSIFRAGASNALCVAAVTGNVQVFVSYAQY